MSTLNTLKLRATAAARRAKRATQRATSPAPGASAADPAETLFIGHTRFSVHQYGSGFFNATRDASRGAGFSEDEYTAWLYDDERLAPRTEIFTQISLPQLAQAAKKYKVAHFVSYSPDLPEKHRSELEQAARKYDFLHLNETTKAVSANPTLGLIKRGLALHDHTGGVFGIYRLDDDDVLSVHYFDHMAPYVTGSHAGWWVSLGLGFSAIRTTQGEFVYARQMYYPKSAFGPMVIAEAAPGGKINHIGAPKHTALDKYSPTVLDSRDPAYFHIRHASQDSTVTGDSEPFYPAAFAHVRGEGPADLTLVKKHFPLLRDRANIEPGPRENATVLNSSGLDLNQEPTWFDWAHPGSLVLQAELPTNQRIKPKQARVHLKVESTDAGVSIKDQAVRRFFAAANVHWADALKEYHTFFPHQGTGLGQILCVQPPEGVRITGIGLSSDTETRITQLSAYHLQG